MCGLTQASELGGRHQRDVLCTAAGNDHDLIVPGRGVTQLRQISSCLAVCGLNRHCTETLYNSECWVKSLQATAKR